MRAMTFRRSGNGSRFTGNNNWSGLDTNPVRPSAATGQSMRRIGWSHERWSNSGSKHCETSGNKRKNTTAFRQQTPLDLTQTEKERISTLANDVPALWDSPATSVVDRKEIVRCLVERVVVQVQGNTEYVDVTIHWAGGFVSQQEIVRPVSEYRQMRDYGRLVQRLRELREAGRTAAQIAETLDHEGFHPTGRRKTFSALTVRNLMSRLGLSGERPETVTLQHNERWLSDMARELHVSLATVRRWITRGWVHARRSPRHGYHILWADDDEVDRLGQLRDYGKGYPKTHPFASAHYSKAASHGAILTHWGREIADQSIENP